MSFDEILDQARSGEEVTIDRGWAQGRATFGGLLAALLLTRAEAACTAPDRPLRSASTSFIAPVAPGPVHVTAEVLRSGSSLTQISATVAQDGAPAAVMLASFGRSRPSAVEIDAEQRAPAPELPGPAGLEPIRPAPGITPEFFAHLDVRFAAGAVPYSGAREPDFGGWMRFATPPREFTTAHLLALTDAWPPSLLPMFPAPAPGSSVSWMWSPVGEPDDGADDPGAFWRYRVRTDSSEQGYTQSSARVWDADGRLRAVSHQLVAVFA